MRGELGLIWEKAASREVSSGKHDGAPGDGRVAREERPGGRVHGGYIRHSWWEALHAVIGVGWDGSGDGTGRGAKDPSALLEGAWCFGGFWAWCCCVLALFAARGDETLRSWMILVQHDGHATEGTLASFPFSRLREVPPRPETVLQETKT